MYSQITSVKFNSINVKMKYSRILIFYYADLNKTKNHSGYIDILNIAQSGLNFIK